MIQQPRDHIGRFGPLPSTPPEVQLTPAHQQLLELANSQPIFDVQAADQVALEALSADVEPSSLTYRLVQQLAVATQAVRVAKQAIEYAREVPIQTIRNEMYGFEIDEASGYNRGRAEVLGRLEIADEILGFEQ